jgi:hypothetical protein
MLTYRCACGFCFDQPQDGWSVGRISAMPS